METLAEQLRARGLKATPQRLAVAQAMLAGPRHATPQQLRAELAERFPTLSLNTLYQMLHAFVRHGLLREVSVGGRTWFDSRTEPHAHAVCRSCGRIEDVPAAGIEPPEQLEGWALGEAALIWEGLCPRCGKEDSTRP